MSDKEAMERIQKSINDHQSSYVNGDKVKKDKDSYELNDDLKENEDEKDNKP